jgi:hypothetical protein
MAIEIFQFTQAGEYVNKPYYKHQKKGKFQIPSSKIQITDAGKVGSCEGLKAGLR